MGFKLEKRNWGQSEIHGPRHKFREKLMLEMLYRYVEPGKIKKILEAGCGSATFSASFLEKNAGAIGTGFDSNPKPSAQIEDLMSSGRFTLKKESFRYFSNLYEKFDLVILGEVLEHIEDDKGALVKVGSLMEDDSILLISVPHQMSQWSIEDVWAGHKRRYEIGQLRKLLTDSGFDVVEASSWGYPVTYLYDKMIFQRLLKENSSRVQGGGVISQLASKLLFALMHFDKYYPANSKGLGIIAICKKSRS